MKKIIAAGLAVASLAFASGAFAQAKPLTTDTPIQDIVANPEGKAVLDKDLPGLTTHAAYDQFKSMSLKDLQPMSQGAISDEALKKVSDDLAKVKPQ
jgi:hypothetical protein